MKPTKEITITCSRRRTVTRSRTKTTSGCPICSDPDMSPTAQPGGEVLELTANQIIDPANRLLKVKGKARSFYSLCVLCVLCVLCGEIPFIGVAHVLTHATNDENESRARRPCHIDRGIAHVLTHATNDENESRARRPCHIDRGGIT